MKKILIALVTTSALAAGVPAAAQNAGVSFDGRVGQLQTQIQTGVQNGDISRAEAMPLRDQLRQLSRLERQYRPGGISGRERADLQRRINTLRQQIRMAERSNNGRDRYGDNDRYDRDDDRRDGRAEVDGRHDGKHDGRHDRDTDRDGRWNDDRRDSDSLDRRDSDRDARWEAEARDSQQASGGGVIGDLVNRFTGGGGLRVGQQASSGLYGVPAEYRDRYRDGDGAYYRSDGRQIYQIDARTHVVARVHPMSR